MAFFVWCAFYNFLWKCAHRGICDWFWLSFWPPWTIQDNGFTSQKRSTHFDLSMYLLHVRFDSVRLLSALDRPWQVRYNTFIDFDPCSHRRVKLTILSAEIRLSNGKRVTFCWPSYYSCTLVASSYRGQNHSTACFDCWPKCAHRGISDCFFTVILTTINDVFTSQNGRLILTCKCTYYT